MITERVMMMQAALAINWAEDADIECFVDSLDNTAMRALALALLDDADGHDIRHLILNMAHPNKIDIHALLDEEAEKA